MARSPTPLIVGLVVLASLVVGLRFFVGTSVPASEPPREIVAAPPPVESTAGAVKSAAEVQAPAETTGDENLVVVGDPTKTNVAWAAKLSLELVQPAGLPRSSGMATLGSGANARFVGSVRDGRGEPVAAQLNFIAGPNKGRALSTNTAGKFGASDLYPGLSVVEIDGPGYLDARREVRLRGGSETTLNLGFGLPGAVGGRVIDREDKPIAGATIEVDGQIAFSDLDGKFLLSSVPSGLDLECIVSMQGFAAHSELVTVSANKANADLVFRLMPGASLDVEVPEAVGAPGEASIVLMNQNTFGSRSFPWRLKNPIPITPGSRVRIDDLPPGVRVRIYVFHTGAYAKPEYQEALLQEGSTQAAIVHLEPAPVVVGTVRTRDGLIVQGAKVRLEAPDRVGSTVSYFEQTSMFLESEVLPNFPMGLQETLSDHNGRFEFTSFPKQAPKRYLIAESVDGKLSGSVVVGPEDETVNVVIGPSGSGNSLLKIEFPGRHQAIEVLCSVQGAPRDPFLLPAHDPLVLEGLAPGTWRLKATWNGQDVPMDKSVGEPGLFVLQGETTQLLRLPRGAIDGQDEDTLLRTGRRN
jgi:hypothetical protein